MCPVKKKTKVFAFVVKIRIYISVFFRNHKIKRTKKNMTNIMVQDKDETSNAEDNDALTRTPIKITFTYPKKHLQNVK